MTIELQNAFENMMESPTMDNVALMVRAMRANPQAAAQFSRERTADEADQIRHIMNEFWKSGLAEVAIYSAGRVQG